MYFTSPNLVHYLIDHGKISRSAVVEGDFQVYELDSHNRCFKVRCRNHPSLFVKQIKVINARNIECLEREAACYRLARTDERFAPLKQIMPRFVDYDTERYAVIVELLPNGEDVRDCHRRLGAFPIEIGDLLGRRLGEFHADLGRTLNASNSAADVPRETPWIPPEQFNGSTVQRFNVFPRESPWILSVHRGSNVETGTAAQLTDILRQDADCLQALDAIRAAWRLDSLIHGDLKWDNCIVSQGPAGDLDFRVVDWELADLGDSAWDVGTVIQSYWSHVFLSTLPGTENTPQEFIEQSESRLDSMRPAVLAFWNAYRSARGFGGDRAAEFLTRSVRYAAARMIQSSYEYAGARGQVINRASAIFQVGCDLLKNSQRSRPWLLGLATRD